MRESVKVWVCALFALLGATVATVSHAAVPTEASDAITGLATDGAAMIALFWPVVTAVVVALILIKLFKKGSSRAT
jgi:hypothetical protein